MDEKAVWDRQVGESSRWFERFWRYLQAGPGRSALAIYNTERARIGANRHARPARTLPHSWAKAKVRFTWEYRATSYDDYVRKQEDLQRQEERTREQQLLVQRRQEQRQQELELAQKLYEKALALLALPVEKERREDGEKGNVTVYRMPQHQAFAVAARLSAESSGRARLALDMPLKYEAVDIRKMSDAELLYLLERLSENDEETP
ncbi:MAG: hypothetical protein AB7G75_10955 [Candidatus Binatia bacterium]